MIRNDTPTQATRIFLRRWALMAWVATLAWSGFASHAALAGQSERFGQYVIYYSALSTDLLPADIARRQGFERSSHVGLVNVTILRDAGGTQQPATGSVRGTATNLSGQSTPIVFRPVKDAGGISWLGTFPISGSDTFRFELVVVPSGDVPHAIVFSQDYVPN